MLSWHPFITQKISRIFFKVESVMREILEHALSEYEYDKNTAPQIAQNTCAMIKERVKRMQFRRYKFVCNVVIGMDSRQGVSAASRAVWNDKTDNSSVVIHKTGKCYALATVHAVYFE